MGCLSFHPRKIVTTGEGGAVTTGDGELAAAIRRLRHHGLDPDADIAVPSTNYRLADILCAIAIPQLRRLDELLAERTRIAEGYTERILDRADLDDVAALISARGPAALLCVERDPEACHRSLVAARLRDRAGFGIVDLRP